MLEGDHNHASGTDSRLWYRTPGKKHESYQESWPTLHFLRWKGRVLHSKELQDGRVGSLLQLLESTRQWTADGEGGGGKKQAGRADPQLTHRTPDTEQECW